MIGSRVLRLLVLLFAASLCAALSAAFAASLVVSAAQLQAGTTAVAECDGALTLDDYSVNASFQVTSIVIGDIAGACIGGEMRVTLTQSGTALGSGGPVTITGATEAVAITGAPDADSVNDVRVVIVGP